MVQDDGNDVRNNRDFTGRQYVQHILDNSDMCYDLFRMSTSNFTALCDELVAGGGLDTSDEITIEEQLGMFLMILGQEKNTMREVGIHFLQHSPDIVHRVFNNVLNCVFELRSKYIKLPDENTPIHTSVAEGTTYSPFKGALGAIECTHIPAHVVKQHETDNVERYRNKKRFMSQNVLVAVDFDMKFVYVMSGWEGSAHDSTVLEDALDNGNFKVPANRYYLADGGYGNNSSFIGPYRRHIYHLAQFNQRRKSSRHNCPEELYNHRHAQLRNIAERAIGLLKSKYKILTTGMSTKLYKFGTQAKIVVACCVLHNFLKERNAQFFGTKLEEINMEETSVEPICGCDTQAGNRIRDTIRNALWHN